MIVFSVAVVVYADLAEYCYADWLIALPLHRIELMGWIAEWRIFLQAGNCLHQAAIIFQKDGWAVRIFLKDGWAG